MGYRRERRNMTSQEPHHIASYPQHSAWVSANAGSGKTYILVTRIIRLLLEGSPPEKLLCLTYTRAAATEMQERLFDVLVNWVVLPDKELKYAVKERIGHEPDQKQIKTIRGLFAKLLETPSGMKIQTIHAFCESLLHRFPLEAEIIPNFRLIDEYQKSALIKQKLHNILTNFGDKKLMSTLSLLTRRLSKDNFYRFAENIIEKRDIFQNPERESILKKSLNITNIISTEQIIQDALQKINYQNIKKICAPLNNSSKRDQALAQRLTDFLHEHSEDSYWKVFSKIFLTTGGKPRASLITKSLADKHPFILEQLTEWEKIYEHAEHLRCKALTYEITTVIYEFADSLIETVEQEKQYRGLLDYHDLIEKTVKLLTEKKASQWVLYKMDGGLNHILIDEAQDTNPLQWEVIKALGAEFFTGDSARNNQRSVFAVGDEKQSIFSFQGADPNAFEKMRIHFSSKASQANQDFKSVSLIKSRRSVPQILQFVDYICEHNMMNTALSTKTDSIKHVAHRHENIGCIELWEYEKNEPQDYGDAFDNLSVKKETKEARLRVAEKIGHKICHLIQKQNYQAGDILILVQTRKGFAQDLLRVLKAFGIPVAGADRMILTQQIAVMDLIALGSCCLLPEDDLSFACYLRSPLGGLSEEDLQILSIGRHDKTLWYNLQQYKFKTTQDENTKRMQGALYRFETMLNLADQLPPFEFYMHLLSVLEGRVLLKERLGVEVDDPVNAFLDLALEYERHHIASLQGFLHWVESRETEIKRDMEQGGSVVRIMTIHGAKGLEAPIVFLPDACRPPLDTQKNGSSTFINHEGIAIWSPTNENKTEWHKTIDQEQKQKTLAEYKRLFYVAITRACDYIYITGFLPSNGKQNEHSWYSLAQDVLKQKGNKCKEDTSIYRMGQQSLVNHKKQDKIPKLEIHKNIIKPDWLDRIPPEETSQTINSVSSLLSKSNYEYKNNNPHAIERGKTTHKLLESLSSLSQSSPTESIKKEKWNTALQAFRLFYKTTLPEKIIEEIIFEVLRILETPEFSILHSTDARMETPIIGTVVLPNGKKKHIFAKIDVYIETNDNIIIADYKTNRHIPTTYEEIPKGYLQQMAFYFHLVSSLHPSKNINTWLVWTANGTHTILNQEHLIPILETYT